MPDVQHQIAPDLQDSMVPLGDLKRTDSQKNPRRGNVENIMNSLKRFGQVRPIVVQEESGQIVAGNHTYEAAKRLGWTHIAITRVNMSEDEAQAYIIADNHIPETGTYDDAVLVDVLKELAEKDMLDGTGFDYGDVDDLEAALADAQTLDPEDFKGDYAEDPSETGHRVANVQGGTMREVVFLLDPDTYDQFAENVGKLKRKYALDATGVTIAEAIRREAETADVAEVH